MDELLSQLRVADQICRQANEHFVRGQQRIENASYEKFVVLKSRKKLAIIMGAILPFILVLIFGAIFMPIVKIIPFLEIFYNTLCKVVLWGSFVLVIVVYMMYKQKVNKQYEEAQQQAARDEEEGQSILQQHAEEMSVIPVDCWYPLATEYLIKALENGRADTLKEALQQFDEQLHRWNMEASYANMLAEQQRQTQHLRNIERNTRDAATAAWFSATR